MADWDVVVIGGGAAGLSTAAAVAGAGRRCVLIDRMGGGGELMNLAGTLHDLEAETTGPDLAGTLLEQALGAGVELAIDEVTALARDGDRWVVTTAEDSHGAPSVVLATGLAPGTLGLPNEHDYEGRGLSHCAACDGPLYRGDPVVVVGTDRWAVQEARDLVATAGSVALVTQGAPAAEVPGVTVIAGRVTALDGAEGLEAVEVTETGAAPRRIPARAVFLQAGRTPALGFAPAALARAPDGRLAVDESLRCSMPGLFAVGEARGGFPSTLKAAMEDGRIAAAALS